MQYTQYYNLGKPDLGDKYSIDVHNRNSNIIDAKMHELEESGGVDPEVLAEMQAQIAALQAQIAGLSSGGDPHTMYMGGRNILDVLEVDTVQEAMAVIKAHDPSTKYKDLALGDWLEVDLTDYSWTSPIEMSFTIPSKIQIVAFDHYYGVGHTTVGVTTDTPHVVFQFASPLQTPTPMGKDDGMYKDSLVHGFLDGGLTINTEGDGFNVPYEETLSAALEDYFSVQLYTTNRYVGDIYDGVTTAYGEKAFIPSEIEYLGHVLAAGSSGYANTDDPAAFRMTLVPSMRLSWQFPLYSIRPRSLFEGLYFNLDKVLGTVNYYSVWTSSQMRTSDHTYNVRSCLIPCKPNSGGTAATFTLRNSLIALIQPAFAV